MLEGFIARRLMRNVSIAELVRRSFTVSPKLFLYVLPILLPVMMGLSWVLFFVVSMLDIGVSDKATAEGAADARMAITTALMSLFLFAASAFGAPLLSALLAVGAIRTAVGERL